MGHAGGVEGGAATDPVADLRDGGGFLLIEGGEVAEGGVPSAGERGGGVGGEEEWGTDLGDSTVTELRFVEPLPDEVGAVGGDGAGEMGGVHGWEWGGIFEVEEREGEVREGVRGSRSTCGNHVDTIAAVVLEGRAEEKCSLPVVAPGGTGFGGVVGDNKLSGGVDGVGGKINGETVDAVPCRDGGVGCIGEEVIEGEFGLGEEFVPEVGGEFGMGGSERGDEVVFASPHATF
jgi:hypothetical protein